MRSFAKNVGTSVAATVLLLIINRESPEAANMIGAGIMGFCIAALIFGKEAH